MNELKLIPTRKLDVVDITRCEEKHTAKFTAVQGALIRVIIAQLLLIAILI